MASVNWISPPAPRGTSRNWAKMLGARIYRPTAAKREGASPWAGFSTIPDTGIERPIDNPDTAKMP